jgi:hypothetical protein
MRPSRLMSTALVVMCPSVAGLTVSGDVLAQTPSGLRMAYRIYDNPKVARRLTIRQDGVLLGTLELPEGVVLMIQPKGVKQPSDIPVPPVPMELADDAEIRVAPRRTLGRLSADLANVMAAGPGTATIRIQGATVTLESTNKRAALK